MEPDDIHAWTTPDCGCWSLFDPSRAYWVEAEIIDAALLRTHVGPAWPEGLLPGTPIEIVVVGIGRPATEGALEYYRKEILATIASSFTADYAADDYVKWVADAAANFLPLSEAEEVLSWLETNWGRSLRAINAILLHGVYNEPLLAADGPCIRLADCVGDPLSFEAAASLVHEA